MPVDGHRWKCRVPRAAASTPGAGCMEVSPTWELPEPRTWECHGGFLTEAWPIVGSVSSPSLVWRQVGLLKVPGFRSWPVPS